MGASLGQLCCRIYQEKNCLDFSDVFTFVTELFVVTSYNFQIFFICVSGFGRDRGLMLLVPHLS